MVVRFFALLFLICAGNSWSFAATTYYVATTGNDANSGGQSSPFRTSQRCANAAMAGDTCIFRAGSYAGFSVPSSGSAGSPITFKNYSGEVPTIDPSLGTVTDVGGHTNSINLTSRNYITIDGLKVTGTAAYNQIQLVGSAFVNILNCEASSALGSGIGIYDQSHDVLVQNCRIFDNAHYNWPRGSVNDWAAGMIAFHGTYNITFKNNAIYFNHGEGVTCGDASHHFTFDGNVVSDNWSVNLYASDGCHDVVVKNNVIYNTEAGKALPHGTYPALDNWAPGIVLAVGDSNTNYSWDALNLQRFTIINNIVVNCVLGIQRFNGSLVGPPHPDSDWLI